MKTRITAVLIAMMALMIIPALAQAGKKSDPYPPTNDNNGWHAISEDPPSWAVKSSGNGSKIKYEICHRTASDSNPYVLITVRTGKLEGHQKHPAKHGRFDVWPIQWEGGQSVCPFPIVEPTCETDPSLCPPPPTCETDPSLCPPPPTCETDQSLCPPNEEPPVEEPPVVTPPVTTPPVARVAPVVPPVTENPSPCAYEHSSKVKIKITRKGFVVKLRGQQVTHIRWFVDGKKVGRGRKHDLVSFLGKHIVRARFHYTSCGETVVINRYKVLPRLTPVVPQFAG